MNIVTLSNKTRQNQLLQAQFCPDKGMNLLSFKKNHVEIIDQKTHNLFEQRCAGLGALIGPHFHHRAEGALHYNFDETLFPHISLLKKRGQKEYFSHGIARYVPWKYKASETQIDAILKGSDNYRGLFLKDLEGQDFEMFMNIHLIHDGLTIRLTIHSEKPSVIGFHYYYLLKPHSVVEALTQDHYRDDQSWKKLPESWYHKTQKKLHFELNQSCDFGFQPVIENSSPYYKISLKSDKEIVTVEYISSNMQQTSWQLYHPKDESFVCIEPLSALNPKSPKLNSSNLELKLNVFETN